MLILAIERGWKSAREIIYLKYLDWSYCIKHTLVILDYIGSIKV